MKLNIPVGISNFQKVRESGYYYVDKSMLISRLVQEEPAEVTLITRPRRFGKTMSMSMLASFFDIHKDSRTLFDDLCIAGNESLCREWMNQWPVIFFTLKDIDGLCFEDAYEQLKIQIADLYKEYTYLLGCERIDEDDRQIFLDLKAGRASKAQVGRALSTLMRMLQAFYGRTVILLLDEYDVPLAKASQHGYYTEMLDLIKTMMSTALKDNRFLKFAVITGCLKIAKESIFTGTNNFVSDTIKDSRLNEYFGFTQEEVNRILQDADAAVNADKVKAWYDGYHFGKFDIYCPWDVMNYIRDFQNDSQAEPASYWKNTSDNAIIRSFIDYAGSSITKKLEKLMSGGYILEHIDENLTYDYLHASEENLWSILYLTGYLTSVRKEDLMDPLQEQEGMLALMIPNAEIQDIFETTIVKWFDDTVRTWNRQALFAAVWQGNCEQLMQEMTRLLRKTISYYDYKEDFYHAFLAGIFAGAGYTVESNREHGEGRSDIIVYDTEGGRAAVFEAKYSKNAEQMAEDCNRALDQIRRRMYSDDLEDEYDAIYRYGIAFYKKRCDVKMLEDIEE